MKHMEYQETVTQLTVLEYTVGVLVTRFLIFSAATKSMPMFCLKKVSHI